VSKILVDNGS
jgi:hypothetical protein